MSEAIDRNEPPGAPLGGLLAGNPECASCSHVHRRTVWGDNIDITYDARCDVAGCECTASGSEYDHGIVDGKPLDGFFDDIDILRTVDDYDDDDDGPSTGPRCLPFPRPQRPSDTAGTGAVDAGGRMRRGWLGRFVWRGLSRFSGHQRSQLDRVWGHG